MSKTIYQKMNELPVGTASDKLVDACLICEGGAFRALYETGVMDAMMMNDYNFKCVVGVSAGAMNGLNYISGQIGRSIRIDLGFRHDSRYVGLRALLKSKGVIGFDFLYEGMDEYEFCGKFNKDRFMKSPQRFVIVVANCNTGKEEYIEKDSCEGRFQAVRASASMPFVSKMVDIDGQPYLDGGCICKIPYQWAIDQGFKKIVVIRTQHADYRKKIPGTFNDVVINTLYRKYPKFRDELKVINSKYNRQCEEILELQKSGRIFVISPSAPLTVGRLDPDLQKLADTYYLGYNDFKTIRNDLDQYLAK